MREELHYLMNGELTLKGEIITKIDYKKEDDEIHIETKSGETYIIMHLQSCCENVKIHSIEGELSSLIGKEVLEYSLETDDILPEGEEEHESYTRTVIKINDVVIIGFGVSNGYYSEKMTLITSKDYHW